MRVFITNGMARSGKDTFARLLGEQCSVVKLSAITCVKELAKQVGWDGKKDERNRKFLSDLKMLLIAYNDYPFNWLKKKIAECPEDAIVLIDIREPEEIAKAAKAFNAKTILVVRDSVKQIVSNYGDAHVNDYHYDYVIKNNGTIDDLRNETRRFLDSVLETE